MACNCGFNLSLRCRIRIILLLLLLVVAVNCSDPLAHCDDDHHTSITPLVDYDVRKDRGGLNGMCQGAERMRHDIIRDEFPYKFAAEQAKLW